MTAAFSLAVLSASAVSDAAPERGVEVEHLGVNTTLVRITGDGRYLLLPVQESNDEANIKILTNARYAKDINVRLAKSKVDYYVPLDLEPFRGNDITLLVETTQSRSSVREARNDAFWREMALSDTFDVSNREKYRPAFHHTPLWGWMNDPNGMVYKDGKWHLYYQYNPYGSKWHNMSWGHSVSTDLVNWEHQPVVLESDGLGMIFSGSGVVDHNNTAGFGEDALVFLYTSADRTQQQSLAWSNDGGQTLNVYPGNPVITMETEARDPNMYWNEERGEWVLYLAHALDHEMLFFTSPDMKTWTLQSSFGNGIGSQDGVWECPDLFRVPVDGGDSYKWVLLCNINPGGPFGGSATQYFVGDFDGHTFTVDRDADGTVPVKWLDYGKDHYATVSWSDAPDDRRTVIGWMSNWQYAAEVPTMQFRSANTLPRDITLFTAPDGRLYAASAPSPELLSMRGDIVTKARNVKLGSKARNYALPSANDGVCEIVLTLTAREGAKVNMTLANHAGEKVDMVYDVNERTFSFDRNNSGITDFSQDFPAVTVAPTFSDSERLELRIYVDRSSIEVFGDDGRFVMTNLVFPTAPYSTLAVSAQGNARIADLRVYSLKTK